MTDPNSPLSPSSHSSFDDDDEAPFDPKAAQPPSASSLPPSTPASPHMPPLLQAADEQSAESSASSSRRHSLSSASSLASPHLPSSHLRPQSQSQSQSLSSGASTPASTPSSSASAASNPSSPFLHGQSIAQLNAAAAAEPDGKRSGRAEATEARSHSQQQPPTAAQHAAQPAQPAQPAAANAAPTSATSPSLAVSSLSGGAASSGAVASAAIYDMSQLASEAAVLANSHTLHRAMMAAAGHTALVQQQQQQQQHQQQHQQHKALTSFPASYAANVGLSSLSSLQYPNRAPLPAPLASLPPLALSFSSHTSAQALTPSAAAAAAGNNALSSFASSLHSNLFKTAASAGIMRDMRDMRDMQLLHAAPLPAVGVNGMGAASSAPHSPLPAAAGLSHGNGINWALTLPSTVTAPASPQPYSTPSQSASPASTPPGFSASSSSSSLASLSALALPAPSNAAAAADSNAMPPPSPYAAALPASPTAPMLAPINSVASSTLSPYAYSLSSSSPSPNTVSSLTQPGSFARLPSLPLNLPSPTLQSLYPTHFSHLLPSGAAPFAAGHSSAPLSSASFAAGGGSSSSSPLSSAGGLSAVSWPTAAAAVASAAGSSSSNASQLNRYLIHFPADTAHGAQSGLYQPGKPSQLIIHMAEADAPNAPQPLQSSGGQSAGLSVTSAAEGEALPAGHSVIRIPVKVAIKPTVKRTAKLRTLHEVSLHPAWYDCDSRDLSEEEKRWETGSKAKKPKYLLLRHDTKSCIHVLHVDRWTADEQAASTGADDQLTAATPRDGMASASSNLPTSATTSAALSGLLNSLTAAGGTLPFVPPPASASTTPSASVLPLHILPVSDDSMAHVQTKGRGKTEDRRKETAQLYLSLKVDKWYELRCHSGWRIVEMEMKHHKGGHQISSVVIPFHYLPGDLTVGEGVQAITLLAAGSQPHSSNPSSSSGPASSHGIGGKKGRGSGGSSSSGGGGGGGGSGAKMEVDGDENGRSTNHSKGRSSSHRVDEQQHYDSNGSERKAGKSGSVKQEASQDNKGNGGRSSNKRKHSRDNKQSAAAAAAAVAAAAEQKKQHQQHQQQQASSEARSIHQKNLQHLALVNSMMPFTPSGPATIYMQHPPFSQLSPSSPSTASYPQLPNVPNSLPLSISAFDPSLLLQQPGTPNASLSLMSPNTAHLLSGQLSPSTLFASITNEQYAAMVRRGGVGAGNASPGGLEGLNFHQHQQRLQDASFYISTNSAFKTRAGSKGGGGDKAEEDSAAVDSGSGQKRRKVGSGGSSSGGEGAEGEDSKPEGVHDDSGSTLSGGSAGDDILAAGSSSSPNTASSIAKPPRDVSAIDRDPLMFDSSFLLRSESSASTFSLPGTTISLHPFASAASSHSLLPPQPSTYHNAHAAAAAALAAASAHSSAASSSTGSGSGSGSAGGATKPHPPPSIKIPTASRLSPSLSPLLSQGLGMTLSPSPSLVPLASSSNYYTLSPPPSTPSLMDSDGLFAAVSAAGLRDGHGQPQVRRSV